MNVPILAGLDPLAGSLKEGRLAKAASAERVEVLTMKGPKRSWGGRGQCCPPAGEILPRKLCLCVMFPFNGKTLKRS